MWKETMSLGMRLVDGHLPFYELRHCTLVITCSSSPSPFSLLSPHLLHLLQFMSSQSRTNYTVCLCPNNFCQTAGIWSGTTSLGTFQRMTATSTLGGPQVLFTHGDNCPEGKQLMQPLTLVMQCYVTSDLHHVMSCDHWPSSCDVM